MEQIEQDRRVRTERRLTGWQRRIGSHPDSVERRKTPDRRGPGAP